VDGSVRRTDIESMNNHVIGVRQNQIVSNMPPGNRRWLKFTARQSMERK
jgi:hypothetical protein